ncbi:MAG: cytochrome C [Desulfuromonadales bacterium]|nr:cytochrome C [Desulfuromonadales bacterium]NIR33749.1 cytochrome C [Desulfuromonadales bacterium]NIS43745.1 cytochrome C [Desulfuromonadales bacterium]
MTRRLVLAFFLILLSCGAAGAQQTVCIECHAGQPGSLGEPVSLWRGSIHAANGNSCHGCHGGDPTDYAMAMSPERGFIGVPQDEEIPEFCGRCHVGVQEDYTDSAHGQALGEGGPQCVTCHNAHDVQKATPDLINREDCSRCHEYGRAEEIKAAVVDTDQHISSLEEDLADLHRLGIATKELEGQLFSLRNRFHRLFHSVDVELVRAKTAEIKDGLDKVAKRVGAIEEKLSRRKMAGGVIVALLALAGVLATLIRKTYQEEE